jgi:hypothetical protein
MLKKAHSLCSYISAWTYPSLVVPIAKKLRFLFLSMRECNPMSKTLEAVIFCVCVPFALFNDGTYASKFDRSQGDTVLLA